MWICGYLLGMNKLNINFPEDLHKRFKAVCALVGLRMTDIIVRLVRDFVEKTEKKQTKH
jgi:hypothetical protein